MRSRVSGLSLGLSDSARETVLYDTFASLAMSLMDTGIGILSAGPCSANLRQYYHQYSPLSIIVKILDKRLHV